VEGWEAGLGSHLDELRGLRVAVVSDWGGAVVSPVMWELLEEAADQLVADCGMVRVDGVDTSLPRMGGVVDRQLGRADRAPRRALARVRRPAHARDPVLDGARSGRLRGRGAQQAGTTPRRAERGDGAHLRRRRGGVDLVITASNPDVAFAADGPLPDTFGGIQAGAKINGRLTFPANLHGNPAISIPAGFLDGLPIGMQVVGPHFSEELLLDLALTVERNRPWPLTTVSPL
jgi:aspartyl-tRNA(Asn)/glutamyl-tRNA(Gln) amidotransferase subunit A